MWPRRAAGEEDDDAGTLLDHASRRTAGGDKLRGQDGLGDQKLRDGQVDRGFAVAVFGDAGAGRVELDVDSSGVLDDPVEVFFNGAVVEGVDYRVAGPAARFIDLPRDGIESAVGPAGEENLSAFGTKLAGHSRPNGAASTEHNGAFVFQDG